MSSVWTFILIWGVWLITPALVDGVEAVSRLITVRSRRMQHRRLRVDDALLPSVSVIVPAHNEAQVIDRCLNSLKAQDYPADRLEIIVVDDGSTDGTAERVQAHVDGHPDPRSFLLRGEPIRVGPFRGTLALIRNQRGGKSSALNAGFATAAGDIIVNIDSDVVLAPNAVRALAEAFLRDPDLDAATGNIEVDWDILEARDTNGDLVLDENGDLTPRRLDLFERFLVRSQFLEYLTAFDLGRRAQAISGTMYSLAGACSAFRREVFADGLTYCSDTVSEDTHLTFDLHARGARIGFVAEARVHLEPVIDWDALYAQRLRWARGQLEVCGVHEKMVATSEAGAFSRVAVPKMLLFDHTLAFPRLVWMPLILCFPLIGYSWRLLATALIAMYAFYLVLEAVNALTAYGIAENHTKRRIEQSQWALLGLPLYRFVVFHFRFSGFLATLTEKQQWTMRGPLQTARDDAGYLRLRSVELLAGLMGALAVPLRSLPGSRVLVRLALGGAAAAAVSAARVVRALASVVLPVVLAATISMHVLAQWRRSG